MCVCVLSHPWSHCIIDLDGPVGRALTAGRDGSESAISLTQRAYYPQTHDNSCLVPAQRLGRSCISYVTEERRGGGLWSERGREGGREEGRDFTGMLVNTEIVLRANRLPVTCSGCVHLKTESSILVWHICGLPSFYPPKNMCCASYTPFPPFNKALFNT